MNQTRAETIPWVTWIQKIIEAKLCASRNRSVHLLGMHWIFSSRKYILLRTVQQCSCFRSPSAAITAPRDAPLYHCTFTPDAARASKWLEVIHFQWEPAASSGESGAARFGQCEHRGDLKSGQLYGNELWRGWAATNQNVEVLRLKGFQRTQPVNSRYLSRNRCASAPLARHESVWFSSGQAHPSGIVQGEDTRSRPSPSRPILAFPDVVLRVVLLSRPVRGITVNQSLGPNAGKKGFNK